MTCLAGRADARTRRALGRRLARLQDLGFGYSTSDGVTSPMRLGGDSRAWRLPAEAGFYADPDCLPAGTASVEVALRYPDCPEADRSFTVAPDALHSLDDLIPAGADDELRATHYVGDNGNYQTDHIREECVTVQTWMNSWQMTNHTVNGYWWRMYDIRFAQPGGSPLTWVIDVSTVLENPWDPKDRRPITAAAELPSAAAEAHGVPRTDECDPWQEERVGRTESGHHPLPKSPSRHQQQAGGHDHHAGQ